jgi:hypothetical protein
MRDAGHSAALTAKSPKTTREVQSPLSCRSKTNSTGKCGEQDGAYRQG